MSTLYIRLPSKSATDSAPERLAFPCLYVLIAHGKTIEQQGVSPLADLSGMIANAQRVVLFLAAADVTLLRVNVPPLSSSRMKSALPNIVEDHLIADPADCVIVAGGMSDGLRTVAVIQRTWLETLYETLAALGARRVSALPAQLCLPFLADPAGGAIAALNAHDAGIDLTLRLSEQEGIGMALGIGPNESATREVIAALCAVAPKVQVTLHVPQSSVLDYQNEVSQAGAVNKYIKVLADNWSRWVAGAEETTLDMMAGLDRARSINFDIREWRWPLALAAAVLVVNLAALNFDWWRMSRESASLRASLIQVYRSAYPKETVIIDPVAQIRQKIAAAKHDAGLVAPDDFTALIAAFAEEWASTATTQPIDSASAPPIAAFEYHDRALFVRLNPVLSQSGQAESLARLMKTALSERGLSLQSSPSQTTGAVWEIRSSR